MLDEIYERFETVIDEMNAAVFEWNHLNGRFYTSKAYHNYAISKVSAEDLFYNRGPVDLIYPDDMDRLHNFFEQTNNKNKKASVVLRLKMIDGSYRWCRMVGFFYHDETGKLIRTVGIIIDINDEHEYSFMLDSMLNSMPCGVGIFVFAEKLLCQYYSDGFAKMSGLTRAEMDARIKDNTVLSSIIAPEDFENVTKIFKERTPKGLPLNLTYRYRYIDGSIKWVHLSATKLRDEEGYPVYYCVFTNPAEETTLYQNIVEDSAIGVYVADRKTRVTLYLNDAVRQICGVNDSRHIIGYRIEDILDATGKQPFLKLEDIDALKSGEYTEFSFERNGRYFGVKARSVLWNNIDAYILYISDETVEHEHGLLLQKLVDEVPGGIGIYDFENGKAKLTYLNDAYYGMLGYKREERTSYYGMNSTDAIHAEDRDNVFKLIKSLTEGNDRGSVLYRIMNSKGEWIWINLAASVIERNGDKLRVYASFSDCDRLVKAQEEMQKSRKKEQALLASIPGGVGIFRVKKNGAIINEYTSEGLAKMFGFEYEEYCIELKQNTFKGVHKEAIPMISEAVYKSVETKQPICVSYYVDAKDGTPVMVRLDANIIEQENLGNEDLAVFYAVFTKVSENVKYAIQEQKHYRTVLDMLGIAYWEWSKENGFYASDNYAKYAFSNAPLEKLKTNSVFDNVVHEDDIPILKGFFEKGNNKETKASAILRMKMSDGTYRWTELLGFKEYDNEKESVRMSCTLRDVNEEWLEQKKQLQEALEGAQKANEAKSAFLSRMSHDMRTPLNGMLGIASLMKDYVSSEQAQSDLAQFEVAGQYLLNLVNDTLDVSRIESGKLELHPSVCDGRAMFDSVCALARPIVNAKKIHATVETSGLDYPALYIDFGRVEQIMMNIISNAVKFTPEGGKIKCTMKNISNNNGIIVDEVSIEDNGIGISKDFLPHIFEPFSQEDASKKNSRQGTGLGMIITKQLIELMGGTISIESEIDKGTRVTYTLVMPVATEEQIQEWKRDKKLKSSDAVLYGKRVLMCEDHPLNAQIAERMLKKKNVIVEHAQNGEAGLEMFKRSAVNYYDAILMDIRMPVMDGLETAVAIRSLQRTDALKIPIIAMTANAFEEDVQQTKEAGMDGHLSKPIVPMELYGTLANLLMEK